jgi:HEAT repeat protein
MWSHLIVTKRRGKELLINRAELDEQTRPGWSRIRDIAERAEAVYEAHGRAAAREIVLSAIGYEVVRDAVHNGDELTRRKSLALLYCWDAKLAAQHLVHVLRSDPCPVVRHEAAYYLGLLNQPETLEPMMTSLREDSAELVRHELAEALGDMGAVAAIPAIQAALSDTSDIVSRTARIALQQLLKGSCDH